MALPRSHRLSLRLHRDRLTKTGKTSYGKFFTVDTASPVILAGAIHESPTVPRLAILLSKKTASRAVDRNKIKRITSSLIENLLPSLSPKDYLVIPKKEVLIGENAVLLEDLKNLILK